MPTRPHPAPSRPEHAAGLRILHVVRSLDLSHGGVARAVVELGSHLAAAGHDLEIAFVLPREAARVPAVAGCRLWHVRGPWSLLLMLWRRAPACELIHSHGVWDSSHLAASLVARLRRRPLFVSEHGMLHPEDLRRRALKKKIFAALLQRRILRGAAGVHALTAVGQQQINRFAPGCPTFVVPNGVSCPQPAAAPATDPAPGRPPTVLYMGRLHPVKGLDVLIDAFARVAARLPEARLRIVGPGAPEYRTVLLRQAQASPAAAAISFESEIHGQQKSDLFRRADVFVQPSRTEGFGLAQLEAMAAGLPVLASEHCNLAVEEFGAGLRVALTPDAFAQALVDLLLDPERRRRLGAQGQAVARDRFQWEQIAAAMAAQYRQVLESSVADGRRWRRPAPRTAKEAARG